MAAQNYELRPGQLIGVTGDPRGGDPHLHLGVRRGYTYFNPLYNQRGVYFTETLLAEIYPTLYPYAEGFAPLDMLSFQGGP